MIMVRFSMFNQKRVHSLWRISVLDEHAHRLLRLSSTGKMKALSHPTPTEWKPVPIVLGLEFSGGQAAAATDSKRTILEGVVKLISAPASNGSPSNVHLSASLS